MWDYHLFVGYLHSDTLKWSYGSVKGREGDSWNEEIGSLKADDMVKALKEAGLLEYILTEERTLQNR